MSENTAKKKSTKRRTGSMIGLLLVPIFLIAGCTSAWAQMQPGDTSSARFAAQSSAPRELWELHRSTGLEAGYVVDLEHLNPYHLMGDFDGDGRYDFVVRVRHRDTGTERIAVLLGAGVVAWLDRDEQLRYPTLTAWYVHPKSRPVEVGAAGGTPPVLRGDAIMIVKVESSSALVYWNGTRFVSYWQGD